MRVVGNVFKWVLDFALGKILSPIHMALYGILIGLVVAGGVGGWYLYRQLDKAQKETAALSAEIRSLRVAEEERRRDAERVRRASVAANQRLTQTRQQARTDTVAAENAVRAIRNLPPAIARQRATRQTNDLFNQISEAGNAAAHR